MNNGIIIFLVIVVLSAIIGAVSQVLKNQQQNQQAKAARARANARSGNKAGSEDIDRFLEEIDKLRSRKSTGGGFRPANQPAPVVAKRSVAKPAKAKPAPALPVARATPTFPPAATIPRRVEELPVAPVVAAPASAPVVTRPAVKRTPPKSDFARQMAMLLGSRQALPAAVVLQEVLGPPKCRRPL